MGNSIVIHSEETQSTEKSKANLKDGGDQFVGKKKFGSPYMIKPPNITDFKQKSQHGRAGSIT